MMMLFGWDSQLLQGDLVPIGEPVDPERLALILLGDPLRLLRIERDLLDPVS